MQGMATKPGEAPTLRQDHYNFIDYNDPQQADHLTKLQQQAEHHAAYNSGQGSASAGSARGKEDRGGRVPVLTILGMTIFMSAMAGFGAVPFFFCGKVRRGSCPARCSSYSRAVTHSALIVLQPHSAASFRPQDNQSAAPDVALDVKCGVCGYALAAA